MNEAICQAAFNWLNSSHSARLRAVNATLSARNRFTPQALDFAIDQVMGLIKWKPLSDWIRGRNATRSLKVGVFCAGNIPFAGLQDLLAVSLTGHQFLGVISRKSPALLPAFAEEACLPARFVTADVVWNESDAIVVTGTDATIEWALACAEERGIQPSRRLLRGNRYSVAIIDETDTFSDACTLASDVLMNEGMGCRSVAIVWTPKGLDPEPYWRGFQSFRRRFPPHGTTVASLKSQASLLEALGKPHVYGSDDGYLISPGPAVPQGPGHLRWCQYTQFDEVTQWLESHKLQIQCVFAGEKLLGHIPTSVNPEPLGSAQSPPLDWQPDRRDTVAFLTTL